MSVSRHKLGRLLATACGTLALSLTVGMAFGQSSAAEQYDQARGHYTTSPTADAPPADATPANPSANQAPSQAAQNRTVAAPRAGSRNYTPDYATPPRSASVPNRTPSPNATQSSYTRPVDPANANWQGPDRPTAQRARQTGWVDSITQQFSGSPAPNYSNNYPATYNQPPSNAPHYRTAAVDRSYTPHLALQPGSPGSVLKGEDMPQGKPMPPDQGMPPPGVTWNEGTGSPEMGQPGCESCGNGCGSCGCGSCGSCGCGSCCCLPLCGLFNCCNDMWQDFSVDVGVQGFKGPVDQGVNGDFGFHEGINWGSPLWDAEGLGTQIGFEAEHSDLSRTELTALHRNQYFVTAGVFHRQECECGWEGGLVYDYLQDDWIQTISLGQIRGEVAYVVRDNELGFWFTAGVHDTKITTNDETDFTTVTYRPLDLYAIFIGHQFCGGGEARFWGGFTGGAGALVGADFSVPLNEKFALEANFDYMLPQKVSADSIPPESWNLGINLVWHPCCRAREAYCSSYRPLFDVANNGTFMMNHEETTGLLAN